MTTEFNKTDIVETVKSPEPVASETEKSLERLSDLVLKTSIQFLEICSELKVNKKIDLEVWTAYVYAEKFYDNVRAMKLEPEQVRARVVSTLDIIRCPYFIDKYRFRIFKNWFKYLVNNELFKEESDTDIEPDPKDRKDGLLKTIKFFSKNGRRISIGVLLLAATGALVLMLNDTAQSDEVARTPAPVTSTIFPSNTLSPELVLATPTLADSNQRNTRSTPETTPNQESLNWIKSEQAFIPWYSETFPDTLSQQGIILLFDAIMRDRQLYIFGSTITSLSGDNLVRFNRYQESAMAAFPIVSSRDQPRTTEAQTWINAQASGN